VTLSRGLLEEGAVGSQFSTEAVAGTATKVHTISVGATSGGPAGLILVSLRGTIGIGEDRQGWGSTLSKRRDHNRLHKEKVDVVCKNQNVRNILAAFDDLDDVLTHRRHPPAVARDRAP
jgi:hypothetical protein